MAELVLVFGVLVPPVCLGFGGYGKEMEDIAFGRGSRLTRHAGLLQILGISSLFVSALAAAIYL